MSPVEAALEFMECINRHDADKLAALMTEDHAFIDSLGNAVRGREQVRAAWKSYYAMCPDYWVTHEEVFDNGKVVAVFGAAGGTIATHGQLTAKNKWRTPAAWLAVVDGDLIQEWRVFADNKPVYDILAKLHASQRHP